MSSEGSKLRKVTTEGKIKITLSLMLVVYSAIVSMITGIFVFLPMALSWGGDLALMKKRNCFYNKADADFKMGVFFFMLAHMFYAMRMETEINHFIVIAMGVIAIIVSNILADIVRIKGNKDIVIIPFYAIVLILSVVNTFFFNKMAFAGGILFFISDSLIGLFMLLKNEGYGAQVAIWATYVPAQILMLTSFII